MDSIQWQEVDPEAIYPEERYRAVSGEHEFRIFYDPNPEDDDAPQLAWILGVRELPPGGVPIHVYLDAFRTEDEAKKGAEDLERLVEAGGPWPSQNPDGHMGDLLLDWGFIHLRPNWATCSYCKKDVYLGLAEVVGEKRAADHVYKECPNRP